MYMRKPSVVPTKTVTPKDRNPQQSKKTKDGQVTTENKAANKRPEIFKLIKYFSRKVYFLNKNYST